MNARECPYCSRCFSPSRFQPAQQVCSDPDCQKRRRAEGRKRQLERDPEYRSVCADSRRKWREAHPDYQRRWRASHPDYVARNREQQRERDLRRRLRRLVKNNAAFPPNPVLAEVWFLGEGPGNLVKNNADSRQLLVVQPLGVDTRGSSQSCKEHPSGGSPAIPLQELLRKEAHE
jgi:hypothetical protein